MTYNEIITKVHMGQRVYLKDVSGIQFMQLLHDKIIKQIQYDDDVYEINFVPIEEHLANCIYVNDRTYPIGSDTPDIIRKLMRCYKAHEPISMDLDDECFQIIVEVLETKE